MAQQPFMTNRRLVYWLFLGLLSIVVITIVSAFLDVDTKKQNAHYASPFVKHGPGNLKKTSQKRKAPGFYERDIEKRQGRRYETY